MSWTEEKVSKLKELWGKGNTASQIAEIIGGISRNAVIGKAHRLGLSGRMASKKSNGGISIIRKKRCCWWEKQVRKELYLSTLFCVLRYLTQFFREVFLIVLLQTLAKFMF